MRLFKFAPPKGPGYGIAKDFHLSVLAATAHLPTLLEIVNPKGDGGAAAGFGVPLARDSTREDLAHSLERGAYGIASPDKKSVLQMMVISKEEAGFDPEIVARSSLGSELSAEVLSRVRATWHLIQFVFRSHDASVLPAMEFLYRVAKRVAELTDGCIADPLAERYLVPSQVCIGRTADGKVLAEDHVSVKQRVREGGLLMYTLGMRKFALQELEVQGVAPDVRELAETFLLGVCQGALSGRLLQPGDRVGARSALFQVAEGGLDRGMWEGIAVFELLPPTGQSVEGAIKAWAAER